MSRAMFRYQVPVDDQVHWIALRGDPQAFAAIFTRVGPGTMAVEFWAEHDTSATARERAFQVFGTGHPLPGAEAARYVGTCARVAGLVWHLYELADR